MNLPNRITIVRIVLTFAIIAILILYPCVKHYPITGVNELLLAIATFTVIYLPLFWKFSMNDYERALLKKPFYNRKKYIK